MSNTKTDYTLVDKLSKGDNRAFAAFYKENRDPFFRHFNIYCQQESQAGFVRMKFKAGDLYLDDLYQTSCIRLYEMVTVRKLYAKDEKIYYVNKSDVSTVLSCSLLTLLKSIGFNALKEMERANHDSGSSDIDELLRTYDDSECAPDELLCDDDEEDLKVAIVRNLMFKMTDTCRKIFTALYGVGEDTDANESLEPTGNKKVKGVDVVEKLGYSSPESFRNQKARCVNKFKVAFEDALRRKKN